MVLIKSTWLSCVPFSACPPGPAFPSLSPWRRYASLPRQRRGRQRGALCHGFLWHWRCQAEGLQPRAKEGGLGSREQQVSHGHGRIHGWPFTWVAQKAQNQEKTGHAFGKQRRARRTGAGQVLSEGNLCWQRGVGHVQEYTSKYTSAGQKISISCNQEVTEAKKCTVALFLDTCFYCEVRILGA